MLQAKSAPRNAFAHKTPYFIGKVKMLPSHKRKVESNDDEDDEDDEDATDDDEEDGTRKKRRMLVRKSVGKLSCLVAVTANTGRNRLEGPKLTHKPKNNCSQSIDFLAGNC